MGRRVARRGLRHDEGRVGEGEGEQGARGPQHGGGRARYKRFRANRAELGMGDGFAARFAPGEGLHPRRTTATETAPVAADCGSRSSGGSPGWVGFRPSRTRSRLETIPEP